MTTRIGDQSNSVSPSSQIDIGEPISTRFQLVEAYNDVQSTWAGTAGVVSDDTGLLTVGLRWRPLSSARRESRIGIGRYVDLAAFYAELDAGCAVRERVTFMPTTRESKSSVGLAGGVAVGLLAIQGEDYAIGVEAGSQLSRLSDVVQWDLHGTIVVQVRL